MVATRKALRLPDVHMVTTLLMVRLQEEGWDGAGAIRDLHAVRALWYLAITCRGVWRAFPPLPSCVPRMSQRLVLFRPVRNKRGYQLSRDFEWQGRRWCGLVFTRGNPRRQTIGDVPHVAIYLVALSLQQALDAPEAQRQEVTRRSIRAWQRVRDATCRVNFDVVVFFDNAPPVEQAVSFQFHPDQYASDESVDGGYSAVVPSVRLPRRPCVGMVLRSVCWSE